MVELYLNPSPMNIVLAGCLITPVVILAPLFGWLGWRRLTPELEPQPQIKWGELTGDPQLDPEKGIYANALVGTEIVRVLIQPKWWQYLPPTVERGEQEALMDGSNINSVSEGKEPSFLVVIQNEQGETKGMGSRVKLRGRDVLLTAFHVTQSSSKLFIAKYSVNEQVGKRIEIQSNWEIDCYSPDPHIDIVAVCVPSKVWSALGVGCGTVCSPNNDKKPITVYGADSSSKIKCTHGVGYVMGRFTGAHNATTVKSWSGSPIISGNKVIGVHRGSSCRQNANRFSVLHPLITEGNQESMYDHGYYREIEEEEIAFREETFEPVFIRGRGAARVSNNEYFRDNLATHAKIENKLRNSGIILWADMDPDADDDMFFEGKESQPDEDLNSKRAVSGLSSPPSNKSVGTSTPPLSQSDLKECHSLSLESRVLNLEKLLELSLTQHSKLEESILLLSKTMTGLSAAVERNSIPSSSKPPDSKPPSPPPTSKKPPETSSKSTPKPAYVPVSKETGTSVPLKRASRRSRKKSSKGTPLQESPSAP